MIDSVPTYGSAMERQLVVTALGADADHLYDSGKWCYVLALPEMLQETCINVFNYSENAITHVLSIDEWRNIEGLVYEIKLNGFDEVMDHEPVRPGMVATQTQAMTGRLDTVTTIIASELRYYPEGFGRMTDDQIRQLVETDTRPQHDAIRAHPDWASSIRRLAKEHCYSTLYQHCDLGLLAEIGLRQGFITLGDIELTRRLP